jgi:hypothetical protein
MNDPGFFIEMSHPGAERGIGCNVFKVRREFKITVFKFSLKERNDLIFPERFKGAVPEVGVRNPSGMIERKTADRSREMDMNISFEVSPKGMKSKIYAGDKALL